MKNLKKRDRDNRDKNNLEILVSFATTKMYMMTSKILKFVKSSKTQQSQYLENDTFFGVK